MMNNRLKSLIITLLAVSAIVSCNKNEPEAKGPEISFPADQSKDLDFARAGGSATLKFTAGKTWTIKVQDGADWLKASPTGGGAGDQVVTFTATENGTGSDRSCTAVISCGIVTQPINVRQTSSEEAGTIEFTSKHHDFFFDSAVPYNDTQTMTVKVSGAVKPENVVFSSSDTKVGVISRKGVFSPMATGRTTVTASDPVTGLSASREVIVTDYSQCFGKDCAANMMAKYSRPTLCGTQGQSFDITPDDKYSYHVNNIMNSHNLAIVRVPTDGSPIQKMYLKYWGHGDNVSVERDGEDDYIWMESYGNCENHENTNDKSHYYFCNYQNSESIGRIKFTPDVYIKPQDCAEHFIYPNARMVGACIDEENNQIAFEVRMLTGNGWKYIRVYDLDEVKNAPVVEHTTNAELWVGGKRPKGNRDPSQTQWLEDTDPGAFTTLVHQKFTFKAHDISQLTPLANVCLNKLQGIDQIQSFDLSHEKIYVYCGGTFGGKHNEALMRVVDFSGNSVVMFGTDNCGVTPDHAAFEWVRDNDKIKAAIGYGGCGDGNMETEGMQVKNGNLYIGFSPVVSGDDYHMWIFGYKL